MVLISKAKRVRKANIKKAQALNPFHPRQLRHQKSNKLQTKSGPSGPPVEPSTSNSNPRDEFDRQEHMKKCTKLSVEKVAKKKANINRRILGKKAAAWNRQKSRSLSEDVGSLHILSNLIKDLA